MLNLTCMYATLYTWTFGTYVTLGTPKMIYTNVRILFITPMWFDRAHLGGHKYIINHVAAVMRSCNTA